MKIIISTIKRLCLLLFLVATSISLSLGAVLYDNGPLVNSPGSGSGGADESILQTITLGDNILGWGHQVNFQNVVADDFTVSSGMWNVSTITFYAYQTGSSTASTITEVRLQIWDGPPNEVGSNLVFGDLTTNRMASTTWSGIYRVTETTMGSATNRPIMKNVVNVNTVLGPGTYWLAWQTNGTLGSGPWAPPVTILGQGQTGNARQSLNNGGTYNSIADTGSKGFPFIIEGTAMDPTISQTDSDGDGNPDITDPCACGDPLNIIDGMGQITHFHDFVLVVSGPGETWQITALNSGAIFDNGLVAIPLNTPLVEISPGVYKLDLWHPVGVGFNVTVDRTAGGGPFPLVTGGTCNACPLVGIPAMGEWGLIILALLLLSFATVFMMRRQTAIAGFGNVTSQSSGIPFDKASFAKMLVYVMIGLAAAFAVAVSAFGYEMTAADVPGSLLAGPALAYLLHLVLSKKD